MVANGTPCLGPVTHAGCGAICPAYNRGCYGCFGPMESPNVPALVAQWRALGIDDGAIVRALRTFNANAPEFREESREHELSHARARSAPTTSPASRARARMFVRVRGDEVEDVQFKIFEPPRFFEALLRGPAVHGGAGHHGADLRHLPDRLHRELRATRWRPSAAIELPEQVRLLRRLVYCGEWIESHVLHMAMLHAPDFLGYEGAVELARDRRDLVETALRLKKAGNTVMEVIGGREPCTRSTCASAASTARPRAPSSRALVPELEWARDAAIELTRLVAGFDFPDFEQDYTFVALRQPGEYAIERGRIVSSTGLDIDVSEYEQHFTETHVERSNALHSTLAGVGSYLVGPLARYALNSHELSPLACEVAAVSGARTGRAQPVPQHRRARRRDRVRRRRGAPDHRAVRATRAAVRRSRAPRRHGLRLHRGPARNLLAPIRDRLRGDDSRREDRAADLAEPEVDRGGSHRRRPGDRSTSTTTRSRTGASRRSGTTTPASPARPTS